MDEEEADEGSEVESRRQGGFPVDHRVFSVENHFPRRAEDVFLVHRCTARLGDEYEDVKEEDDDEEEKVKEEDDEDEMEKDEDEVEGADVDKEENDYEKTTTARFRAPAVGEGVYRRRKQF